jgi:hypothetical protein
MFILILILIAVFLAMAGATAYLLSQRSRMNGQLWAADRDAAKARAKALAASRKLAEAQAEVQRLTADLSNSIGNTGQAMAISKHIGFVSQQLRELMAFISPLAEEELSGAHARRPMPTGELPGQLRQELADNNTRGLPYIHAGHRNGAAVSIPDGAAHQINWEGTGQHGA